LRNALAKTLNLPHPVLRAYRIISQLPSRYPYYHPKSTEKLRKHFRRDYGRRSDANINSIMAVEEKARVAKQYEDVVEIKASLSKLCGYGRWKLRLAK